MGLKILFSHRHYGDERFVLAAFVELDDTVAESEQGMVFAHSDILARVVDRTALTHDDVAGDAGLTAKNFHT